MSQPNQSVQADTPTSSTPTLSAQEILQSLETAYLETSRNLASVRESLTKSQEAVISAQDASIKAFHLLTVNKERHLINLIVQVHQQNTHTTQELEKIKQLYQNLLNRPASMVSSNSSNFLPSYPSTQYLEADQLKARQDNLV